MPCNCRNGSEIFRHRRFEIGRSRQFFGVREKFERRAEKFVDFIERVFDRQHSWKTRRFQGGKIEKCGGGNECFRA